mmetsp:Transcript_68529/g.200473  ORF Transcript_68529/g.200473 Transcript_68529/m.200473 type:complete len:218 (+) Transcript_68529:313-966(+)
MAGTREHFSVTAAAWKTVNSTRTTGVNAQPNHKAPHRVPSGPARCMELSGWRSSTPVSSNAASTAVFSARKQESMVCAARRSKACTMFQSIMPRCKSRLSVRRTTNLSTTSSSTQHTCNWQKLSTANRPLITEKDTSSRAPTSPRLSQALSRALATRHMTIRAHSMATIENLLRETSRHSSMKLKSSAYWSRSLVTAANWATACHWRLATPTRPPSA